MAFSIRSLLNDSPSPTINHLADQSSCSSTHHFVQKTIAEKNTSLVKMDPNCSCSFSKEVSMMPKDFKEIENKELLSALGLKMAYEGIIAGHYDEAIEYLEGKGIRIDPLIRISSNEKQSHSFFAAAYHLMGRAHREKSLQFEKNSAESAHLLLHAVNFSSMSYLFEHAISEIRASICNELGILWWMIREDTWQASSWFEAGLKTSQNLPKIQLIIEGNRHILSTMKSELISSNAFQPVD